MSNEIALLKLVCQRLDHSGIPYMLTGSLAGNFYSVSRMTRDIDIVIEIQDSDVGQFSQIFQGDFYFDRGSIAEAIHHQGMFNLIHNNSIFKVDFIVRKDSDYRSTEFKRKRQVTVDGVKVWVVSPEDLIISKLFWAKDSLSEMQIKDVLSLYREVKDLDREYIQKWIKVLDLDLVYKRMLAHA
jgi:predicted nucleotidyltransferase